ncbi:MAG: right-handed parallel beta-helix repeat-containing protein [Candidatus Bathyarchaeota archaeon]|nr:right-handed parallel beta-helix repeat-containing protein [Candidatus Bathyarchaeota archaeon]
MMKRILPLVLLFILCFGVTAFPSVTVKAEPNTLIVPDNYSTIQAAIDAASEGDTIFVKAGNYVESLEIGKSISIVGEDKQTTKIDGDNTGPTFLLSGTNIEVTGFTVVNDEQSTLSKSRGPYAGIHLLNADSCKIYGNIVLNCGKGVWLYSAHNNQIFNNTLSGNNYGIILGSSENNEFTDNVVSDGWGGIMVEDSSKNTLRGNNISCNVLDFAVSSSELDNFDNDVDLSNLVNGKKLYYVTNQANLLINPVSYSDIGALVLINCSDITFRNMVISNNSAGIHLVNVENCEIKHNVFSKNHDGIKIQFSRDFAIYNNIIEKSHNYGILARDSENISVYQNDLMSNKEGGIVFANSNGNSIADNSLTGGGSEYGWSGISLVSCDHTQVTNNTLLETDSFVGGISLEDSSHNLVQFNIVYPGAPGIYITGVSFYNQIFGNNLSTERGSTGIHVYSSFNEFAGNNITNFWTGIEFWNATHNIFTRNVIESRTHSVEFWPDTSDNTFFMNNFQGETLVFDYWYDARNIVSVNVWDDGETGNYWAGYNGEDMNSDGIGDVPYNITYGNQDNYPLMDPVENLEIPEFGSWAIPMLLFSLVAVLLTVYKRRQPVNSSC